MSPSERTKEGGGGLKLFGLFYIVLHFVKLCFSAFFALLS